MNAFRSNAGEFAKSLAAYQSIAGADVPTAIAFAISVDAGIATERAARLAVYANHWNVIAGRINAFAAYAAAITELSDANAVGHLSMADASHACVDLFSVHAEQLSAPAQHRSVRAELGL